MVSYELLRLTIPILVGQLSQMLIGVGDVYVSAHHSAQTVASIGIANGIASPIFFTGVGLLLGISPILAHKKANGETSSTLFLLSSFYGLFVATLYCGIMYLVASFVDRMGFDPKLIPDIQDYMRLIGWSGFGGYLFITAREFLQAYEKIFWANAVAISGIFLNLLFNYLFVFGLYGFPEMGPVGVAVASLLVRLWMGIVLSLYVFFTIKSKWHWDRHYLKKLVKIGMPVAFSIFFETSAFGVVSVLIGQMGIIISASHNIVLTMVSIAFMFPLSLSSAVAVKIGKNLGENNQKMVDAFIRSSTKISMTFMGLTSLTFLLVPQFILSFFTKDIEVITSAIPLLLTAGFFQLFDGLQVTMCGVLRGLGHSLPTFFTTLIGYWIVGLPLGWILANTFHLQALGLWVGLAVSLAFVGIILFNYIRYYRRKTALCHS